MFLWHDIRAALRARRTKLAMAAMVYAVVAVPFLLAKPSEDMLRAVGSWFGTSDRFALFLYVWTDLAMNKLVAILGVVLAGGVVVEERATRLLPVLLSKPITPAGYYVAKVLSAAAVMALIYVGAHLAAAPIFARTVAEFRYSGFFASMGVHLFAALFAVSLSAAMAVWIGRRALASLLSLLILFMLVGSAFIGFYNAAWKSIAWVNPFTHGIQIVAHTRDLEPVHIVLPVLALLVFNAAMIGFGALGMRRLEA